MNPTIIVGRLTARAKRIVIEGGLRLIGYRYSAERSANAYLTATMMSSARPAVVMTLPEPDYESEAIWNKAH